MKDHNITPVPLPLVELPPSVELQFGRTVLASGIKALQDVSEILDEEFTRAINIIFSAPAGSRIAVSGMGKAGFVAMKLSATLASIGFPSFFLHPADAVHGDLGRITKNDVVLFLSHSGETNEILRLLPALKRFGASIISVTGTRTSNLARHSDVVIATGKIPEAGSLGLAPTTSTTVMMALGDALAMTLVERRGFTKEEFAVFHPGGDLGRSLMTVAEMMRTGDAHCIVKEAELTKDVLHAISKTKGRPGAAAIVDESGILVGVFTDGNLRLCLEDSTSFLDRPIREVATHSPKTITQGKLAQEAARIISEFKIDQIIVVDEDNRPVGLVDIQDLLAHGMISTSLKT